ncbi:PREDICTED: uncharacterized protein LOC104591978 [Nelumbo nucifera]|uniref:Small ribosomal subunit protein mS38 n=2 Tax=Nelumbo nucifera TaxID=4432 RepID=A0A1U7ZLS6_NELNU|nr:PREDICTED: uncharacterized protein LOC104591978 [Nelumbo nucifera]DAD30735.1 TPA_asm: hypothetical protein HUJ06_009586 [Nelumbo nucifera]
MAGLLHKFLKKPYNLRIITSLNKPQPPNLAVPFGLHEPSLSGSKSDYQCYLNPTPDAFEQQKPTSSPLLQIFPNFPFGYYLNPIPQTGFDRVDIDFKEAEVGSGDTETVWADSVKKKRKKKMNKHKYKKLRKRLRRQT